MPRFGLSSFSSSSSSPPPFKLASGGAPAMMTSPPPFAGGHGPGPGPGPGVSAGLLNAMSSMGSALVPAAMPAGGEAASSPSRGMRSTKYGGSSSSNTPSSVRLCCTSRDGKAIFSLDFQSGVDGGSYGLQRRTLPLHTSENDENTTSSATSPHQEAKLPNFVQSALDLNPPVELLCVEGDNNPKTTFTRQRGGDNNALEPCLLCLYTRREVFYLELKMNGNDHLGGGGNHEMYYVKATTAYEKYFLNYAGSDDEALTVIRVRAAPQKRMDYATFCPRGAMAMLTHNAYSNEYSLVLQHNYPDDQSNDDNDGDALISIPLQFSFEEFSAERGQEDVTDFCFAQSDELSLLSTMTILLLKGSGSVHAASPILFDRAVIPNKVFMETLDFLNYQLDNLEQNQPKHKQCKVARRFLIDAFGDVGGGQATHNIDQAFLTARVVDRAQTISGVSLPVKIQGPILLPQNNNNTDSRIGFCSIAIENFSSSELVGVAIGGEGAAVDLGIMTPSCLLPRFVYEAEEDSAVIDDKLMRFGGAIVQRLILRNQEEGEEEGDRGVVGMPILTNQSLSIVRDTMVDSMLHFVTSKGVLTVETTAMRQALRKIQGGSQTDQSASKSSTTVRNSAWASVSDLSGSVKGAVVGTETRFGHALYVKLSDGSIVPINVTESRFRHEMDHLINPDAEVSQHKVPPSHSALFDDAVKRMEELPPLHEEIEPLLKKVSAGLNGLGKIVGSETKSKDITPDQLAVALRVKERCDKEVVLPLIELKRTVHCRREQLKAMFKDQREQISFLKKNLAEMQERMTGLKDNAASAQESAASLAKRADAVFQASQDLQPTITQAEAAYFEYLKRQKKNLVTVKERCNQAVAITAAMQERIKKGEITCNVQMSKENIENADRLLDGQEKLTSDVEARLNTNSQVIKSIAKESGMSVESTQ